MRLIFLVQKEVFAWVSVPSLLGSEPCRPSLLASPLCLLSASGWIHQQRQRWGLRRQVERERLDISESSSLPVQSCCDSQGSHRHQGWGGGGAVVLASLASQLQAASGLPTSLPQMPAESSCAPCLHSIHLFSELVSFISDLICISYKNPLIVLKFKILVRNFPSGPVVKAPSFQCRVS